jgi:DNA-binding winged helix-turn-helix (wHTH) protein/Flp pilus assembly protein TadD
MKQPPSGHPHSSASRISLFGPFRLQGGHITSDSGEVRLSPKEEGLMAALVEASGAVISTNDLIDRVWGDAEVGPASLNRCISTLRQRLAHVTRDPVIATHHRRGYRLALPIRHFDTDATGRSVALDGTPHKIAVDLLLQAHQLVGRRSETEIRMALSRLERAVEIDPNYLPALSAIADLQVTRALRRHELPRAAGERAIAAAEHALRRYPEAVGPMSVHGFVRAAIEGDTAGLKELDDAVVMDAGNWLVRFYRAWVLTGLGRHDDAGADLEAALAIGPMNPGLVGAAGYLLFCCGREDRALEVLREGLTHLPLTDTLHAALSAILSWRNDHEAAIEHGRQAECITGDNPSLATLRLYALARVGAVDEAMRGIKSLLGRGNGPAPSLLAPVHLALGFPDDARAELLRAEREGCPYRQVIRYDPRLEGLDGSR